MTKANLLMTLRNRTALFWNLVFPAIFILIFGTIFSSDQIEIDVGIVGPESAWQAETIAAMEGSKAFSVFLDGSLDAELSEIEDGNRDAVIVFPESDGAANAPVTVYYDDAGGPFGQISVGAVQQVLLGTALGDQPIPVETVAVSGTDFSYMDFFLPGIIAMSLMNSGVIGLSTSFVSYRERGILRRIRVTPFPLSSFISSRIVSQLIVAVPQSLILIGLASLFFDLHIRGNPLLIGFVIVIGALAFLAIGFAISSVARNVESAASYANLITFPMLFLSGVFFSIDNAPAWLQPITRVLPLRFLVDALRETMTRGHGLGAIWINLVVLGGTFAVGLTLAVRFFRWEARPH
ncbi:ABC transporter permease [soil metagenome]